MPLQVLKLAAPEWFTPSRYKKVDEPPAFKITGLTGSQQAEISPEVTIDADYNMSFTALGIRLMFQYGLHDWRNVVDDKGEPVVYTGLTAREAQDLLVVNDQTAIAARIFNITFLQPDVKKKS